MYKLPTQLEKFSLETIPDISKKTVVLRSCLNVSVDSLGKVIDDTRIIESLPTIRYLADNAKRLIILGHLGRPKGYSKELSFWNVYDVLQRELGINYNIQFLEHGSKEEFSSNVILSDNIRFFEGEESKDGNARNEFAKELASMGDIFVNDSFADYRESASTYDIAKLLPSFLGFKFMEEVKELSRLSSPERPFVAVLGGAKLSEKLDVLNVLGEIADKILVGGAMAYTLLKARGIEVADSLVEDDKLEVAKEIVSKYAEKLVLPIDHLIADTFNEYSSYEYINDVNIPSGSIGIDIGKETIELFKKEIVGSKTILWNGPMGVFEWDNASLGTKEVGMAISKTDGYKLIGGGDTITAINKFETSGFSHICTGGGAMLAYISNEKFPTLDVIVSGK